MAREKRKITFVDVFAGCGGLSLGLSQAGLSGQFAVEKCKHAFATFEHNFLQEDSRYQFAWPDWLPTSALTIETLLKNYRLELNKLRGKIDVLAGGPPCQGYSSAGRRRHDDPRNQLFKSYVKLVEIIKPKVVLIENVRGFTMDFESDEDISNYSDELQSLLSAGYNVHERLIDLSSFGLPQQRTRYFLIAVDPQYGSADPFEALFRRRASFLLKRGISAPVSAWQAISDLEVSKGGTRPSADTNGFLEIVPTQRRTHYQRAMGDGADSTSDLRLARHSPEISRRFREIIRVCHAEGRLNTTVSSEVKLRYNMKKHALRVLDPDSPAPTITSMPDDLLHYSEPRTLTVRENARLQSFPDWFEFRGKYTTGGHLRRIQVPRFTQVANAVPPLVARALGETLIELLTATRVAEKSGSRKT